MLLQERYVQNVGRHFLLPLNTSTKTKILKTGYTRIAKNVDLKQEKNDMNSIK